MRHAPRILVVLAVSGVAGLSVAAVSRDVPIPAGFGPRGATIPAVPTGARLTEEPEGVQVVQIPPLPPSPAPPAPPIIDPLPPAPPPPPPVEPTTTVTSTTETTTSTSTTVTTSTIASTPTPTSTTPGSATTSTTVPGCVAAPTFPSVDCRLADVIAQANTGNVSALRDSLLKRLELAQTKVGEASVLVGSGSSKKIAKRLKSAIRKLKRAAALLESGRAKNTYDDATRSALGAKIEALRNDLVTLRDNA